MLINQRIVGFFADHSKQHADLLEFTAFMKHTVKQRLVGY